MKYDGTNFHICGRCGARMPEEADGSFCDKCERILKDLESIMKKNN